MRDVGIIGIGQIAVSEHWDLCLRDLGAMATLRALEDAGVDRADAIYVGNMLAGELSGQENLATLIADSTALLPIEGLRIEAACAAGGAAVRAAYTTVASGAHDLVLAVGVEKMTDHLTDGITAALATAADADYEAGHGVSFVALNALLMRRYMHEHGARHEDFAAFSINSHQNAVHNENAMYRRPITRDEYAASTVVADPITILDSAAICDGAAAVLLCPMEQASEFAVPPIRIAASSVATDTLGLAVRRDPLHWGAIEVSSRKAYEQAGVGVGDIDLYEAHDAFTIVSALSLEAAGFARPGEGVFLARDGRIGIGGDIPLSTMGGLKGRGHPIGASGVYQVLEVVQQLRGEAGPVQVKGAHTGMAQSVGGSGSVAVTHILQN
jgi:acetyl-CoA C-acetyltransferase